MEEDGDFRQWDDLIPDALGLIFKHLPIQEILTVVPRVCKAWGRTVSGPYCWQEIDIEQWSRHRQPETLHRMLQMLMTRSSGVLRKLSISGLPNDHSLFLIADHAKSLQTLRLPRSEINDSVVEQVAARFSSLTYLDVSYCRNIGGPALEAIGKHCKNLAVLRRNMHPLEIIDKISQNDEAFAIAKTMPKLKHLEIAYLLICTEAVLKIIVSCPELELLDIRGCWNVKLDVKRFLLCGLKVIGPLADCYDINGWDDCSDDSNSSSYLAWDFLAGDIEYDYDDEMSDGVWEDDIAQSIEDVEMTFYDGLGFENGDIDWPPSP